MLVSFKTLVSLETELFDTLVLKYSTSGHLPLRGVKTEPPSLQTRAPALAWVSGPCCRPPVSLWEAPVGTHLTELLSCPLHVPLNGCLLGFGYAFQEG